MAIVHPDGKEDICHGELRGTILTAPRAGRIINMPYSSIFVPDGQSHDEQKTVAEMTVSKHMAHSDLIKAFRGVQKVLEHVLDPA